MITFAPEVGAQHHHRRHHRHEVSPPSAVVAPPAPAPSIAPPPPAPVESPPPPPRATPLASRAGVACAYLSDAAPPDAETGERWLRARQHHTVACEQEASQPPNFNGALTEYQRVYELYVGHPERYRALGNLGRCAQTLGQYDRALEYFHAFLMESPAESTARARVEGTIAALEATLGTVTLSANVRGATVLVDNRELGASLERVRVPVGRHVVELRASGHVPSRQEVQVGVGETVALRFTLESVGRRGVSPVFFWVSVGVAAAAVAGGATFGGMALSLRADIDQRSASGDERARYSVTTQDGERLRALSLTADVLFAGAALFGVGATVLAFVTDFRGTRAEAPRTARSWLVVPMATASMRGASLVVGF